MRLPIQQPSQREIDLLIEDGANAPLDLRSIAAELAELPWIYFEADGPVTARYGDTSLTAPVLRPRGRTCVNRHRARAGSALDLGRRGGSVALGVSLDLAVSPDSGRPPGGRRAARDLDVQVPRGDHRRRSRARRRSARRRGARHSAGPQGRFGDLRVVDLSNRRIPWLIEHGAEPLPVALKAEKESPRAVELKDAAGRRLSVYRIALTYPHLPEASLVVRTDARVFRRNVQLGYERPAIGGIETRGSRPLRPRSGSTAESCDRAVRLVRLLRPSEVSEVTMVVEEGDNSPLPITGVQLLLPTYRLRFFRPASVTLRLLYGDDRVAAPS